MDINLELNSLAANIGTIAVEVVAIAVLFALLNSVGKRVFSGISNAPSLSRWRSFAETAQTNLRFLLILTGLLLVFAVIGANLYLIYRGEYLPEYTLGLIRDIPTQFWIDLSIGVGKVLGLSIAAVIVLRFVRRFFDYLAGRAKAFEGIRANDESIDRFFAALSRSVGVASWLVVLALAASWLELPDSVATAILLTLRVFLIIAVSILILRAIGVIIDSADALSQKYIARSKFAGAYDRLESLVPLLRRSLEYVVIVTAATLIVLQVEAFASLAEWGPRVLTVIGLVFMARVVKELAHYLMDESMLKRSGLTVQQRQRRETLVPLFRSIATYAIYFFVGIMVLKEIGINPTPILAGAGIAGIAVGLGAQALINDMVSGFFILFEEHFLVGDFIKVGDAEGVVESIDLRTTRIRDNAGRYHIVRNGQINELVNYSKDFTNAVVEVGVAYESDLNHVFDVLVDTGEKLKAENDMVLQPTSVKGLDNFGESELTLRLVTRVKPGCHLQVERDLRKRIKEAFDRSDIEIPYARRVLIMQTEGEPVPDPA